MTARIECEHGSLRRQCDVCDLLEVNAVLLDALVTMLNVEGAARIGCMSGALAGLDWKYHFDKAREAIARAGGVPK